MTPTLVATLGGLTGSNGSMALLLVKATIILLLALGITLSMQRASAGARHLVWLVTVAALLLVPALVAWAPIPVRMLPAELGLAPVAAPSVPANSAPIVGDWTLKNGGIPSPTPATDAASGSIEGKTAFSAMPGISILLLI